MSYSTELCYCHDERVQFLRPLSMTCREMRFRLLPWVWGRLEIPSPPDMISMKLAVQKLRTILNGPHTDRSLAHSVKYFSPLFFSRICTNFLSFGEGSRGRPRPPFSSLNVRCSFRISTRQRYRGITLQRAYSRRRSNVSNSHRLRPSSYLPTLILFFDTVTTWRTLSTRLDPGHAMGSLSLLGRIGVQKSNDWRSL